MHHGIGVVWRGCAPRILDFYLLPYFRSWVLELVFGNGGWHQMGMRERKYGQVCVLRNYPSVGQSWSEVYLIRTGRPEKYCHSQQPVLPCSLPLLEKGTGKLARGYVSNSYAKIRNWNTKWRDIKQNQTRWGLKTSLRWVTQEKETGSSQFKSKYKGANRLTRLTKRGNKLQRNKMNFKKLKIFQQYL